MSRLGPRRCSDTASTPLARWVSAMAARTTSSASRVRPRATAATYRACVRSLVVAGNNTSFWVKPASHTGPDQGATGGKWSFPFKAKEARLASRARVRGFTSQGGPASRRR